MLVLLGPSGAGKSTLLDTIAGFRKAVAGKVALCGRDLTPLPPEARRIGIVFQDAALFPHLSVREKRPLRGARCRGVSGHQLSDDLLDRFGLMELAGGAPRSLSGGERQRVALARVLASEPELMLLDEPLSALDQPTREDLRAVLQGLLADQGIPAVHVTHDREEALSLGDGVPSGSLSMGSFASSALAGRSPPVPPTRWWPGYWLDRTGTGLPFARSSGGRRPGTWEIRDDYDGPVKVFYRPEDVILGHTLPERPAAARGSLG